LLLREVHAVAANEDSGRNGHSLSNQAESNGAPVARAASPRYESGLAAIWKELLNVPDLKPGDDFFKLGGHSLLAVQMMFRASEEFHHPLPLTLLFAYPTLEELAFAIQHECEKQSSHGPGTAAAGKSPSQKV
jgi:acyl carrier protein